jgi:hypothetical protein
MLLEVRCGIELAGLRNDKLKPPVIQGKDNGKLESLELALGEVWRTNPILHKWEDSVGLSDEEKKSIRQSAADAQVLLQDLFKRPFCQRWARSDSDLGVLLWAEPWQGIVTKALETEPVSNWLQNALHELKNEFPRSFPTDS